MKQKKTTCNDVFKHLCDNLDEGLDSPKCRKIKRYLHECRDCSTYLDSLKKTIALYRHYPIPRRSTKSSKQLIALLKLEP